MYQHQATHIWLNKIKTKQLDTNMNALSSRKIIFILSLVNSEQLIAEKPDEQISSWDGLCGEAAIESLVAKHRCLLVVSGK